MTAWPYMTLIKDIFKVVWGMMTWQKPKRLQEKIWADFNSEHDSSILFLLDKLKRAPRCFVRKKCSKNRSQGYVILSLSFDGPEILTIPEELLTFQIWLLAISGNPPIQNSEVPNIFVTVTHPIGFEKR
jgi:hypothetical protein